MLYVTFQQFCTLKIALKAYGYIYDRRISGSNVPEFCTLFGECRMNARLFPVCTRCAAGLKKES